MNKVVHAYASFLEDPDLCLVHFCFSRLQQIVTYWFTQCFIYLAIVIIQIPPEFLIFKSPGLTAREIDFDFYVYGV